MKTIVCIMLMGSLFLFSCGKEGTPEPGYEVLKNGLVEIEKTFTVAVSDTIMFSIPNGTETQTVMLRIGGAQFSTKASATGTTITTYVVKSGEEFCRFSSQNVQQVDVVVK